MKNVKNIDNTEAWSLPKKNTEAWSVALKLIFYRNMTF